MPNLRLKVFPKGENFCQFLENLGNFLYQLNTLVVVKLSRT